MEVILGGARMEWRLEAGQGMLQTERDTRLSEYFKQVIQMSGAGMCQQGSRVWSLGTRYLKQDEAG